MLDILAKLGVGLGECEIVLPRTQYTAGEKVGGVIRLTLWKPVRANHLFVSLVAWQTVRRRGPGSNEDVMLLEEQKTLQEERDYAEGLHDFPFYLTLPSHPVRSKEPEGLAAAVEMATDIFMDRVSSWGDIKWAVVARLDIPWNVDVRGAVRLRVE
ncbi:MAG: hypothetical protein HY319_25915 [Armatimonadetes bacterium]|nr:hypothetical protein [Armatimonadota bacterium]